MLSDGIDVQRWSVELLAMLSDGIDDRGCK